MKKIFISLFLFVNSMIFSSTYKDGLYVVKASEPYYNWISVVEVTISNGEISKVQSEDYNSKGEKRTEDVKGNQYMKSKHGFDFTDVVNKFTKELTSKKNTKDIDGIAGATHSMNIFKSLANKALKNAELGDTQKSIINTK